MYKRAVEIQNMSTFSKPMVKNKIAKMKTKTKRKEQITSFVIKENSHAFEWVSRSYVKMCLEMVFYPIPTNVYPQQGKGIDVKQR